MRKKLLKILSEEVKNTKKSKRAKRKKKEYRRNYYKKKQKQKNCISLISKSENKMAHKEMIKFRKKIR